MKLVVGLGNPGPKYEVTRHNAGFLAIDRLVERLHAQGPSTQHQAITYEARLGDDKALLVKPQTFMNLSGRSVAPLYRFYKCRPDDLVVIHDEIDIPAMTLRFKTGGGTAGNNGLRSIDAALGAGHTDYHRIRIGVGRPPVLPSGHTLGAADWVLQPYSDAELKELDPLLDQVAEAVELILQGNIKEAQNRYHRRG